MLRTLVATLVLAVPLVACEGRPSVLPEGNSDGDDNDNEGEGEGEGAPIDLVLDVTGVAPTMHVTFREFASDACEVAQGCVENGFRFSTRLHILLWGDQRGR